MFSSLRENQSGAPNPFSKWQHGFDRTFLFRMAASPPPEKKRGHPNASGAYPNASGGNKVDAEETWKREGMGPTGRYFS
jgi:hypothetical protein